MTKLTKYIVVWSAYGTWYSTVPFNKDIDAKKHIQRNFAQQTLMIKGKNYAEDRSRYKNIQIITIEVEDNDNI